MAESGAVKTLKRSLSEYAETSFRLGMQMEDCLLWGFVTVLAIQSNQQPERDWHNQPGALISLTLEFLDELERQGLNIRALRYLKPPKQVPHTLFHVAYSAQHHFIDEELNYTLDWVVNHFRLNMQWGITPKEIASVMVSLLAPNSEASILDPSVGTGAFLRALMEELDVPAEFVGIEKNEKTALISSLYTYMNNYINTDIRVGGAFYELQKGANSYDYVISNPPVYRVPKGVAENQYRDVMAGLQTSTEMSLNFVQLGLQSLKANGQAAFLVHMGTLFSSNDAHIRREWVSRGWLKGVISLPNKLLPYTSNQCAILLFSKAIVNDVVCFVKADDLFKPMANGQNRLIDGVLEQINIRLAITETTLTSALVSTNKIIKKNYSLQPEQYLLKDIDQVAEKISKQWTPLGDLVTVIQGSRGFKKLPDGEDDFIAGNSISELKKAIPLLEKKNSSFYDNNLIKTELYDLLVQRIGEKPSVHMVMPAQANIIVIDTVFILRFHNINPSFIHFIAEFLSSERGANHISSYCQNVTVQTLSKTILQKITVPIPDERMQTLMMEISQAENQLSQETLKAKALKNEVFDGLGYDTIEDGFDGIRFSLHTLDTALKNKDKISYKVSNQYPYPIAFAYRNLYADREWSATYENQMKFGELILSFMVSVGLGVLNHHKNSDLVDLKPIYAEISNSLQSGISPGHWYKLLDLTCKELKGIPDCLLASQLSASWFKGRGKKRSEFADETMPALISKLNDKKHWRGPKGSHASKDAVAEHQLIIDRALLDIEFLSNWEFFVNDTLNYLNELSMFQCSITLLRGDHPCFEQKELQLKSPLPTNEIYCRYGEIIVNLSPFLVSLFNPNTQRTEIFSIDKKNKNGKYMLKSFDSGQSIETKDDLREKFDLMLNG
ncbi:N-6 DNA methylase [Methylophaga sp.]|uniref:N-6 DNA methylase n=1 Tax=Methylophaga sp. TaxID=2024840 RepID=UPI003A8C97DE